MKKQLGLLLLLITFFTQYFFPSSAQAQSTGEYFKGRVLEIIDQRSVSEAEKDFFIQRISVERLDTKETLTLDVGSEFQPLNKNQLLSNGMVVILSTQVTLEGQEETVLVDIDRSAVWGILLVVFTASVLVVARFQGALSLIGMVITFGIITLFVIPAILANQQPLLISLTAAVVIAAVTIYLSHGFSLKSHLALSSMLVVLLVVAGLSTLSVTAAHLVGLGSEEAYFLQFGPTAQINLQGLLLGGIILGTLGILDDICVSQVSVIMELYSLKKTKAWKDLYSRGIRVGRDHVASLVNTLILAYAGANLPLFLLFWQNTFTPFWVTLNSEVIMEEVIRTLTGSIGVVLAVPLATFISAYTLTHFQIELKHTSDSHSHHH